MNSELNFLIRTTTLSVALSFLMVIVQSVITTESGLSNSVYAKTAKSPYKKSFKRSVRIKPKSVKKSSNGCVQWTASRINEKAKPFKAHIDKYSRQYRIDKNLIKAVITAESCFRVKAQSNKGAQGLMQLIPDTAKRFGVTDSYKAKQNIRGGTKYLRFLMDRFKGDLKKVIASYNAGEGAVGKYKGIPPYKETIQYVKNVMQVYALLKPKPTKREKKVYLPPKIGNKAGRQGWQFNRRQAPHLYKR